MMKSMIAADVPVALGSDGPINPYLNVMFASINANNPAQAMTREQAVSAYTLGSARAEMMETQKGTLSPGMLADLAILSQDIFTAPPDALAGDIQRADARRRHGGARAEVELPPDDRRTLQLRLAILAEPTPHLFDHIRQRADGAAAYEPAW